MVYPSLWPRVRINLKDMRREELSQRDLMKVAQYEVLGWRSEKATRHGRDDRRLFTLVKPQAKDLAELYRPWRDGHCLLHHFPAAAERGSCYDVASGTASPYQKMLGSCNRQLLIVSR
jgi:hypothetical protein